MAGWTFREYGTTTWEFVLASFRPKFLMCSATMSEASLSRAAGSFGCFADWMFGCLVVWFLVDRLFGYFLAALSSSRRLVVGPSSVRW